MTYLDVKYKAIETLRKGGIANPTRLVKLINNAITFLRLDLSGLTVLTEAASGPYVATPVIAAVAGAKHVLALTSDSDYASAEVVIAQTRALEALCGVEGSVDIYTERSPDLFSQADIVTNLGFVRPIDAEVVGKMKRRAVVPLMCEAWEFRKGDVDLEACREKGIIVMATNEDYPGLNVFDYIGWLCMKMLFEAQIEIHKSQILLISSDKFGKVISKQLKQAGAKVRLVLTLNEVSRQDLALFDALVVCDYSRRDQIIGPSGDISAPELAGIAPHSTVIQFAGRIDVQGLRQTGLFVYPAYSLDSQRMAMTLGELGPRSVVELHTAGMKVGELMWHKRQAVQNAQQVESVLEAEHPLCQRLPDGS